MSERQRDAVTSRLRDALWRFSPKVEVSEERGVFWLDASGLRGLYPSDARFAQAVSAELSRMGFVASVVVGFTRFGTYAVARGGHAQHVFTTEEEERAALGDVPLSCLGIEPALRELLGKLGVHDIAGFLELPATGLLQRFGKAAFELHRIASLERKAPLVPSPWREPLCERALLDDAERDTTRLLFVIKRLLDALLARLALRGQALRSLRLSGRLDRKAGALGPEELRPAVPTLDVVQLLDLMRLRLASLSLREGVLVVQLDAEGVEASAEQLNVFARQPRRDLAAGARALARLRAELGEQAVVRAVLADGHLPEATFAWQPIDAMSSSHTEARLASPARPRTLVRRILAKPQVLEAPPRHPRNDGWLVHGDRHGPVSRSAGPYVISGGWWVREVQREYQYLLLERGALLWAYYDRRRRKYFLHGEVQ